MMSSPANHFSSQSNTQRDEILAKLRSKPKVPAYELAKIALQYSARIFELRKAGYEIRNKTKRVGNQIHSTFELVSEPEPFKLSSPQNDSLTPLGSHDASGEQPTFVSSSVASSFLDFEMGRRSR